MPKINPGDYKLSVTATSTPGVTTSHIQDRSVPRARSQRVFEGEGAEYLTRPLDRISNELADLGKVYYAKSEQLRKTNSQLKVQDIESNFLDREQKMTLRKKEQAAGLLDELKDDYDDLKAMSIPEDVDEKTRQELTIAFEKRFNQHAGAIISWQSIQADKADATIRERIHENSYRYINTLSIGNIKDVETRAQESVKLELERHPEYNAKQVADIQRAYIEDFIHHAYTKWFTDNAILSTKSWEENKDKLQAKLPTKWGELNAKYEVVKGDAKYDIANAFLTEKYGGNLISMADDVIKNYKEYGLHADQAYRLASMYQASYNFKVGESNRIKQETEDNFIRSSYEKYYDPKNGTMNTPAFLIDLEDAFRKGTIDPATHASIRQSLLSGDSDITRYQAVSKAIDEGQITTKGQVLKAILGTGFKPEPFYAQMAAIKKAGEDGLYKDELVAAEQTYIRLAKEQKLNPALKNKPILLESNANKFVDDLAAWAKKQKLPYGAKDPAIHEEALRRMELGWYKEIDDKPFKEFHPIAEEGMPGVGTRLGTFLSGGDIEYSTRWDFEAAGGKTETATGGTPEAPKMDEETKAAIEFLQIANKPITPQIIEATKIYLKSKQEKVKSNATD